MQIIIQTIPHEEQRYPTVGDWQYTVDGDLHINVSSMNNIKYEILVGIHELVEAVLCTERNIKEEDVTAFDKQFEADRQLGLHTETEEPGNNSEAPYYKEHRTATHLEEFLARQLKVDWNEYDKVVNSL